MIENNKEGHYLALRQTQGTIRGPAPNWQPWLLFFLRSLDQQKRRLSSKIEKEKLMIAVLPSLSVQIVEHVRQHGRTTMGEIIRLTGASRNTLKEHLAHWSTNGISPGMEQGRAAGMPCPNHSFLQNDELVGTEIDIQNSVDIDGFSIVERVLSRATVKHLLISLRANWRYWIWTSLPCSCRTGCGGSPKRLSHRPMIAKPYGFTAALGTHASHKPTGNGGDGVNM